MTETRSRNMTSRPAAGCSPSFRSPEVPRFYQCVAVSTTSDARGTFNVYAFQQPNFNDYPKIGVWRDAYYATFNMFSGNTFVGARTCAFNRSAMLAGAAATQVCFQLAASFASLCRLTWMEPAARWAPL